MEPLRRHPERVVARLGPPPPRGVTRARGLPAPEAKGLPRALPRRPDPRDRPEARPRLAPARDARAEGARAARPPGEGRAGRDVARGGRGALPDTLRLREPPLPRRRDARGARLL